MNDIEATFIRSASPDDGEAIFHLAERFATSFAVESGAFHSSFSHLLADPSACLLVVELDGVVVGYVLGFEHLAFYANGHVANVEEIMVAETHRQRGIGSRLMDAFALWAHSRECRLIALATRRAATFYRSLGYEESATYFRKLL